MDSIVNLGIVAYFIGVIFAFALPYLNIWLQTNEKFEPKKIISELIGGLFVALLIIVSPGFIEQLVNISATYEYTSLYFISVMLMAMGGGFGGNMVEKLGKSGYTKLVQPKD